MTEDQTTKEFNQQEWDEFAEWADLWVEMVKSAKSFCERNPV